MDSRGEAYNRVDFYIFVQATWREGVQGINPKCLKHSGRGRVLDTHSMTESGSGNLMEFIKVFWDAYVTSFFHRPSVFSEPFAQGPDGVANVK